MGFTLDQVVPWGRNLEEYRQMFSLTDHELTRKMLGCADGPASVNAELNRQGSPYVSLDPIYQYSAHDIEERIAATVPVIARQLEENQADYCWSYYASPQELVLARQATMDTFLADFSLPSASERYIAGSLPELPFADGTFDLLLCSHLLFSYSEQLDGAFHQRSIMEMLRVSKEVRVFPLLEIDGHPSRHLPMILDFIKVHDIMGETVLVNYEFQRGGNQMLTLKTR